MHKSAAIPAGKQLHDILRANFPNVYGISEATGNEYVETIKTQINSPSMGEIRRAVLDLAMRNPQECPSAWEIVRQVKTTRAAGKVGKNEGLYDESRRNLLQALREESDLSKRWSIICHACDDQLFVQANPDGTTQWRKNFARLYVPESQDPCREACRLADLNGIEYRIFAPPEQEASVYRPPDARQNDRNRPSLAFSDSTRIERRGEEKTQPASFKSVSGVCDEFDGTDPF